MQHGGEVSGSRRLTLLPSEYPTQVLDPVDPVEIVSREEVPVWEAAMWSRWIGWKQ